MNSATTKLLKSQAQSNMRMTSTELGQQSQQFSPIQQDVAAGDEIDLGQMFGVLWRGRWMILLFSFLAAGLGGYYAFEVAVPKFSTTARLALQVRDQQVVDLESVMSGVSTEEAAINTELEVIRSRGLMEQLVTDLNLVADPEFNELLREPSAMSREALVGLINQYWPDLPVFVAVEKSEKSAEEILIDVTDNVRDAVSVSSQRNTYLISISAKTESAQKSADMANTLAQIYLDDQVAIKFSATEFAIDWLSERVTELELELKSKEDAIKDLRAETELISLEALEALNIRAKDIRERVSAAQIAAVVSREKVARLETLALSRDIDSILAETIDASLNRLAAPVRSGDLDAQRTFFKRYETLLARAQTNADREVAQLEALQDSYNRLQAQIAVQNEDLVELNQLTRESDATRVLYETFLTRLKETSVQIGLQQADSRILSLAIPGKKVEPRKGLIIALSLLLGSMIGVGIVLLRQYQQDVFRSAEELEKATGYTVFGQIPKMPIRRRNGLMGYLQSKPTSAAAEAIRNLRTSVLLSDVDNPPKVIMSTSSIPGEGKTTQSISLAFNLSGLGKKVLLVEGDIRRRTLDEYFKQKAPGNLINVVSGEQSIEESVIHDDLLNIDVLMGAKSALNAADLFSSNKFKEFVEAAREAYDYVIIDSPPVLVVPDARVVAGLVDVVLYTVKWDSTNKSLVTDGLRQFSSVGQRVGGLVLSQIDSRGMKRYGYGGKYGAYASYGRGYYDT